MPQSRDDGQKPGEKSTKRIMLVDGHSLVYRAYHALPPLSNSRGEPTNAVLGFTTMIMKLLDQYSPQYGVVAFDRPSPTFRQKEFDQYKANRPEMPEDLRPQIPLVKQVAEALGFTISELDGFEADDVIGTLAAESVAEGFEVLIVTGDRDCFQLISDSVKVLVTKKGISEIEVVDRARLSEIWGIAPEQVPDFKGLVGDPSDNIPGVPGIGKKTASMLLEKYGSIEGIIAAKDCLDKRYRTKLEGNENEVLLSKKLATIRKDTPLEFEVNELDPIELNVEDLRNLFVRLEFRNLLSRLAERYPGAREDTTAASGSTTAPPATVRQRPARPAIIDSTENWVSALDRLRSSSAPLYVEPVIDPPDTPLSGELLGIGFMSGDTLCYLAGFDWRDVGEGICTLLFDESREIFVHDLKKLLLYLLAKGVTRAVPAAFDLMIAGYLLNPGATGQSLEDLAFRYLKKLLVSDKQFAGGGKGSEFAGLRQVPVPVMAGRVAEKLLTMAELHPVLANGLREQGMQELYATIEHPLIHVLARMESCGIAADPAKLREFAGELEQRSQELERKIFESADCEFNINSPRQLAEVLFDRLGLPVLKKTKTGPSTSVEVLEQLAGRHEIIDLILEYRQVSKLRSTYAETLPGLVDARTGRIHTTFNQAVTATGRLSSTNPNLQNIPVRTAEGRRIREAFVSGGRDMLLVGGDYSQIELRVLAHISEDPGLIEAFARDIDIHTQTASEVFGVRPEDVSPELRSAAKAINFGIVYGISSFGLAKGTGLSNEDAQTYIEAYLRRYAGVKKYMESTIARARRDGYVSTIFGRRRFLPDINSKNRVVRGFAERTAMNTPIQGSAADIIKLAMIEIDTRLAQAGLKSRLILQVHDELILDCPEPEVEQVKRMLKQVMEGVTELRVPLRADIHSGRSWADLKD